MGLKGAEWLNNPTVTNYTLSSNSKAISNNNPSYCMETKYLNSMSISLVIKVLHHKKEVEKQMTISLMLLPLDSTYAKF